MSGSALHSVHQMPLLWERSEERAAANAELRQMIEREMVENEHHHHRERLHLQSRKIDTNNIIIISSNNSSSSSSSSIIIIIISSSSLKQHGDVQMPNDPTKFSALSRHADAQMELDESSELIEIDLHTPRTLGRLKKASQGSQAPLISRIWQSLHDAGNTPPHYYNFPLRPTDWMTNVRAGRHLPEVESAYLGGGGRRGRARRQIFDDGLAAADQHGQIGQPEEPEEPGNPGQPGSPGNPGQPVSPGNL
uniref:Uncharacterized protein n=1 Tax=Globodera rostochiensis TaxID=31243 RepID=A0A914HRN9_GLORO